MAEACGIWHQNPTPEKANAAAAVAPAAAAAAAAVSQVVKARGEAMAAAAAAGGRRHGMLSVVGLGDEVLEQLAAKARQELGEGTVCQLANYLFPTVSGWLVTL
jgi:malonyl CoA-acyl carrier protein transacylase